MARRACGTLSNPWGEAVASPGALPTKSARSEQAKPRGSAPVRRQPGQLPPNRHAGPRPGPEVGALFRVAEASYPSTTFPHVLWLVRQPRRSIVTLGWSGLVVQNCRVDL